MRARSALAAAACAVVLPHCVAAGAAAPAGAPPGPAPVGDDRAGPEDYRWVGAASPLDLYSVTVVRGLTVRQVRNALGPLGRPVGRLTPDQAAARTVTGGSSPAEVTQVERLGDTVVVYEPWTFGAVGVLEQLSRNGVAFTFSTLPGENYVDVFRRGSLVRDFEPNLDVRPGEALPQERGLSFRGPRAVVHRNVWALMERVTRRPISQRWFDGAHPTWVRR